MSRSHENLYQHWMNNKMPDDAAKLVQPVLSEFEAYQNAALILWDCLQDAQDLGMMVNICGATEEIDAVLKELEALSQRAKL